MKKRLFLLIPNIRQGGGAAKIFLHLSEHFDRDLFDTTVVVLDHQQRRTPPLPAHVRLYNLQCSRARYASLKIVRLLNAQRPDIVLSTGFHLDAVLGLVSRLLPSKPRLVARCINMPSLYRPRRAEFAIYRAALKSFDHVICQCTGMKEELHRFCAFPESKASVITNPVDHRAILDRIVRSRRPAELEPRGIRLVAMGRLEKQKRFDLLLHAMQRLGDEYSLCILGEGSEKNELERLIEQLGLQRRVKLLGFRDHPLPYLKHADYFVSTSRYEGCPNAVIEAMVCGTPAVCLGYDAVYDLMTPPSGIIVAEHTPDALARAISGTSPEAFDPRSIQERAIERHDMARIMGQYAEVLLGEEAVSRIDEVSQDRTAHAAA